MAKNNVFCLNVVETFIYNFFKKEVKINYSNTINECFEVLEKIAKESLPDWCDDIKLTEIKNFLIANDICLPSMKPNFNLYELALQHTLKILKEKKFDNFAEIKFFLLQLNESQNFAILCKIKESL